jgi:hypothetical protein
MNAPRVAASRFWLWIAGFEAVIAVANVAAHHWSHAFTAATFAAVDLYLWANGEEIRRLRRVLLAHHLIP